MCSLLFGVTWFSYEPLCTLLLHPATAQLVPFQVNTMKGQNLKTMFYIFDSVFTGPVFACQKVAEYVNRVSNNVNFSIFLRYWVFYVLPTCTGVT